MYVLIWRYNKSSPWYVSAKLLPSEQDVRAEINSMIRYDVGGRREYRWASIGDADTWHDPFAEQEAREALEAEPPAPACPICKKVHGHRPKCPNDRRPDDCTCKGPYVGKYIRHTQECGVFK